eukprot:scaffold156990_cov31-Tisochrysis_lutea.AAC.5
MCILGTAAYQGVWVHVYPVLTHLAITPPLAAREAVDQTTKQFIEEHFAKNPNEAALARPSHWTTNSSATAW